jgi:hypothetical protein
VPVPAQTITVTVNQATATVVPIPAMTTDITGCETMLVYSCSTCTDPSFAQYLTLPDRVSIKVTSNSYVGTKTIIAQGSIPGGSTRSMDIIVNVLPDCKLAKVTGGEPNDVVKYDISSKLEVIISPPSFQTDYAYCNTLLSYNLIDLDDDNKTADPLVFTLVSGPSIKLKTIE